ncbi:MAG: Na+-translocating ferredoxin:NAD+ oxidoreductase RnfD subunit [Hyphomicrobiaceae bacterium]
MFGRTNENLMRPSLIVHFLKTFSTDARHYQIAVLASLLFFGVVVGDFPISASQIAATLVAAIFVEALGVRAATRFSIDGRAFDPRSPLITALSLCLLLRVESPLIAAAAAAVAIAAKFLIRVRGRHVFNPANLGIVVALLAFPDAWASPGQWGAAPLAAFALACLGTVVVTRAARADITVAFLGIYAGILFSRAWWLGDPFALPSHRLQSGALLLFAFFMISDPRTTPNQPGGRVLFAGVVASLAVWIDYALYWNNGVLWALALAAPLVPLIDRYWPMAAERWFPTPSKRALGGPWAAGSPMLVRRRSGLRSLPSASDFTPDFYFDDNSDSGRVQ